MTEPIAVPLTESELNWVINVCAMVEHLPLEPEARATNLAVWRRAAGALGEVAAARLAARREPSS